MFEKSSANYEYFFKTLSSPKWIQPLFEAGYFKEPPGPQKEGQYIRFPVWPESRYLLRMAPEAPDEVLDFVLQIPETNNVRIHEDLAEIACAVPAERASRWAKREARWVRSQPYLYIGLPSTLGDLIGHLARGGQVEVALDLAKAVLRILPDPRAGMEEYQEQQLWSPQPQARCDVWQYQEILKTHMPDLVKAAGLRALTFLCSLLKYAVRFSLRARDGKGPQDYSYVWRPAIEEHEQNRGDDLRNSLVSAARDAAETLMDTHGKEVLATIERGPFKVFDRIGLHLRRMCPDVDPEGTNGLFTDGRAFEDVALRHEFHRLLEKGFEKLSDDAQQTYLDWAAEGFDAERWIAFRVEQNGGQPTEEQVQRRKRHWQYEKLQPVRTYLTGQWSHLFESLEAEWGKPDHPGFPVYMSTVWSGPTSPRSVEELSKMDIDELIKFLHSWEQKDDLRAPSYEGLGRTVTALVSSESARYAAQARRFKDLDPTYVLGFIRGLREALRDNSLSWRPVLDLCKWVVEQPRKIPGRTAAYADLDPGWVWTRKAIADLLSFGLESSGAAIPCDLRETVWSILRPLTEDPEPSPEDEARSGGAVMDAATLSINTTRGEAMHALMRYGRWVQRCIKASPRGKERVGRGFSQMREVREVLERHLDPNADPSLAVRSVYGHWFPWLVVLDARWASDNVARIFPREELLRDYREVAWETYLAFNLAYDSVFDVLVHEYSKAVEQVGSGEPKRYLISPDNRIAEHLMALYWRGRLDLDSQGLLGRFYKKASDAVRAHAIRYVGVSLSRSAQPVPGKVLKRLETLWEWRIKSAEEEQGEIPYTDEVSEFGSWFCCGQFDDEWAISQLERALKLPQQIEPMHIVIEQLAKLTSTNAAFVPQSLSCLRLAIESEKGRWQIHAFTEDARAILRTALDSDDPVVRERAADLVHRLVALGHFGFRQLLPRGEQLVKG